MILSGEAIRERLNDGQIFRHGSWVEGSLKEASYALRIADDGLLINGEFYDPGVHFTETYIEIEPGKIAILSTKERLNMPNNLMGKIGIRFDQAAQGLTSLIGIQVDHLFGSDKDNERLFIRVANLGNESLKLLPGAEVFTFEVHEVTGKVRAPSPGKESTWLRLKEHLANQSDASWTYVTQVDQDLTEQTEHIREYLQPLVLFGVFLVAVTILGVSISVILNLRETSSGQVPNWMTNWGWILLLITLSLATSATAWVGFAAGIRILWPYRLNRSRPRKRQRWKFWKNRGPQNQRSDPLYR